MNWERRDSERQPFRAMVCCNSLKDSKDKIIDLDKMLEIEITDLSENGIGFLSKTPIDVGSVLFFNVVLSYETEITYKISVRWRDEQNGKFVYGGCFLNEDSKSIEFAKSVFI